MRHFTQDRSPFLVRLACVRHAASVDSEPGSNSRLIWFAQLPKDRGPGESELLHLLEDGGYILCEIRFQILASSHDWHVQLCCQRSGQIRPKPSSLDQGRSVDLATGVVSSNLVRSACRVKVHFAKDLATGLTRLLAVSCLYFTRTASLALATALLQLF